VKYYVAGSPPERSKARAAGEALGRAKVLLKYLWYQKKPGLMIASMTLWIKRVALLREDS